MAPISVPGESNHYSWGDSCDGWRLVDSRAISVIREQMPPGAKEVKHFHKWSTQYFYILRGSAVFYINDNRTEAAEEQLVTILPGENHYIVNEENDPLVFLLTSIPSTSTDRYEMK